MQTQSVSKSELLDCLDSIVKLIQNDATSEGTISWSKNSFGQFDTIAFVAYKDPQGDDRSVVIGNVEG
jgi:hypothetical protein